MACVYTKANFIRHLLADTESRFCIWTADCESVARPDLIDELLRAGCDFAIHNGCAEECTDRSHPIRTQAPR